MNSKCWMVPRFTKRPEKIRVALPICSKDVGLMMANLDWQEELDGQKDYDCVLSVDGSTSPSVIHDAEIAAWRTFAQVEVHVYPPAPVPCWPNGPNWAFQNTARFMESGARPWFWMEPDCVPLRPAWLIVLNQEYTVHRKPIMGVIINGMGHCNGTAIYPANFPRLSPSAMNCTDVAWDGLMKDETIRMTHNARNVICHVWGIESGQAKAFGGEPAHFTCWDDVVRWVDLRAAVFHRAKDTSLIEQLRARRRGVKTQ